MHLAFRSTLSHLILLHQARPSFVIRAPRIAIMLMLCSVLGGKALAEPVQLPLTILDRATHDSRYFTQGFEIHDGVFYESSGLFGQSFIARYLRDDAKPAQKNTLPRQYFAEGLTLFEDALYLVTWKAGVGWRIDPSTLNVLSKFSFDGEGWGLANNQQHLIMSNGSHHLQFFTADFELVKTLDVTLLDKPLGAINELEFVGGILWANRWRDDVIYGIDPNTGEVIATLDCAPLREELNIVSNDNVLNGIAFDREKNAFWLTGKRWPMRFLVKLPLNSAELSKKNSEEP